MIGGHFIAAGWSITATGARKADSTGRRNTFDHIRFEQAVESFCRCSPVEGFAWPRVQRVGNGVQFFCAVLAEVSALGKVLAQQTIGVLVAAALPRALRVTEVNVEVLISTQK